MVHLLPMYIVYLYLICLQCIYLKELTIISFILSPLHRKHGNSDINDNNADDDIYIMMQCLCVCL